MNKTSGQYRADVTRFGSNISSDSCIQSPDLRVLNIGNLSGAFLIPATTHDLIRGL